MASSCAITWNGNKFARFKYARGTGIAVANALESARMAADKICGDNDSNGVALWLEKMSLRRHSEQSPMQPPITNWTEFTFNA